MMRRIDPEDPCAMEKHAIRMIWMVMVLIVVVGLLIVGPAIVNLLGL